MDHSFRKVTYESEVFWGVPGKWWSPSTWREVTNQPRINALDSLYWTQLAREEWTSRENNRKDN